MQLESTIALPIKEDFAAKPKGNGKGRADGKDKNKIPGKEPPLFNLPLDLPDPILSENALRVLERRYLKKDGEGQVDETPRQMFWRVACAVAANEEHYNPNADVFSEARENYKIMAALDFLPNSPTLMNAGRALGQLSACFVLPVEDSMEGIFETVKHAALVHKSGGGTGFSFSRLRPKSSMVASTAGTASGPVSFMSVFNAATETIKQGGTRRGANMGILRVDHPDIKEFITCKRDMVSITNFNISVAVTDKFMDAVVRGDTYEFIAPHTGKACGSLDAREIYHLIAENAWLNGDPGVVFIDEINRCENTPHIGLVEATNPCGEQPLLPYESCNLGSLNLNNMLTLKGEIDWEHIKRVTRRAVRFLDNIIDINKYPLDIIRERTQANRRIGLGIMGFADLLYALGIPYDSETAIALAEQIMKFIQSEARAMSDELALERGAFPNCEGSMFSHPTRNSTVTTIAPTGTISMMADTSGGIEPNFALVFVKRVMDDDKLLYVNRRFEEAAQAGGFYSRELMEKIAEKGYLQDKSRVPENIRRVFVTAHDIAPEWHVRMQAAFQKFTDNAVSKTINFPRQATLQDVKDAYMLAWKLKCKGITIYRDGSREVQVMNAGTKLSPAEPPTLTEAAISEDKDIGVETPATDIIGFQRPKFLKPRVRPRITKGYTEQIVTGEGTLYLTINEDEQGLCEVFALIGKHGGTVAAQSEAIGRLISLALRSGVDPRQVVNQLKGITGPTAVWHEGELIRSTPDAIGRALERYLNQREKQQTELPLEGDTPMLKSIPDKVEKSENFKPALTFVPIIEAKSLCPDCNSPMVYEEGCLMCRSCGYSKCE